MTKYLMKIPKYFHWSLLAQIGFISEECMGRQLAAEQLRVSLEPFHIPYIFNLLKGWLGNSHESLSGVAQCLQPL